MKKLAYILAAGLLLFSTSCDDYLDSGSSSSKTDQELYSDLNLTEGSIMGIYNLMTENRSYRNRMICYMGVNTDIETHSNSKDATATKGDRTSLATYQQSSSMADGFNDANSSDPWSRMYAIIEQANLCIKGIREYGKPAANNQMGTLLAEALTLRAMVYNDLTKYWGDVPARFEPVSAANVYMNKSDRNVIYTQIIDDLKEAEELMPYGKAQPSNTQRVSTTFIKGLRARIALMAAGYQMKVSENGAIDARYSVENARKTELYTIARNECRDIIGKDARTLGSYAEIFKTICQRNFTGGSEIIFQMPFSSSRGEYLSYLGLRREFSKLTEDKYSKITIKGEISVVPSFFYDFKTGDTRRDVTAAPYKWVDDVQTLTGINKFYLAKFRAEWCKDNILSSNDDGIAHCVIRYADILLMAAEAINELEGAPTGEAIGYLEQIRKRAFADGNSNMNLIPYDYNTKDGFFKAIVNERAFEFCGENVRKWDLMRWGMLKEKMDEAKENLNELRDQKGTYADVPVDLYYKMENDNQTITIWGLNRGEDTARNSEDEKAEGWKKKSWLTAVDSSTGKSLLDKSTYVDKAIYQCINPDECQLLPIMNVVINNSQGSLSNYGYLSVK